MSSQSGSLSWLPNLSVLLAVSLGILYTEPHLGTDRAVSSRESLTTAGPVKLNYSWEDPLAAIAKLNQWDVNFLDPLDSMLKPEDFLLFVGLEGSGRSPDVEFRIRIRVAVASALCGKAGMTPAAPAPAKWERSRLSPRKLVIDQTNYPVVAERFIMPAFPQTNTLLTLANRGPSPPKSVTVVYVDELRLSPRIENLTRLAGKAGSAVYIGLSRSGTLVDFLTESAPPPQAVGACEQPSIQIYSPFATISDRLLFEQLRDRLHPETFKGLTKLPAGSADEHPCFDVLSLHWGALQLNVERIGADDDALTKAMIAELSNRGVRPTNDPDLVADGPVLLLADMENLHSKMLVQSFRDSWFESSGGGKRPYDRDIRVIHYPEALDGLTQGSEKQEKPPETPKVNQYGSAHVAEGTSQYDALRRLPDRIRQISGTGPYRAIGLFGSDTHDKILLMRALESAFPETVFFTNDMDALYWQGRDRACMQNLVVASSLGLALDQNWQGYTLPFRSSLQTAAYLATLKAIGYTGDPQGPVSPWPKPVVELHEIGRNGPHLLSYWDPLDGTMKRESPGRPGMIRTSGLERTVQCSALLLAGVALALTLWLTVSEHESQYKAILVDKSGNAIQSGRKYPFSVYLIPTLGIVAIVTALCLWLARAPAGLTAGAEPRTWLSGISAMPAICGNLMASTMGLVLLYLAASRLWLGMKENMTIYPFEPTGDGREIRKDPNPYKPSEDMLEPSRWDWRGRIGWRFPRLREKVDPNIELLDAQDYQGARVKNLLGRLAESKLVQSYARDALASSVPNRIMRVLAGLLIAFIAWLVTGEPETPGAPPFIRGPEARSFYQISDMLAKITLIVTCLFALDSQFRNTVVMSRVRRHLANFPDEKKPPYFHEHRRDFPEKIVAGGLTMAFFNLFRKNTSSGPTIGLWELPLVQAAAIRFRGSAPTVGIPFALLFVLLVTRYTVFEGVSYQRGEVLFYSLALASPLAMGTFAQFQMRSLFDTLDARLKRGYAIHTGDLEKYCQTQQVAAADLRKHTLYSPFENPLLRAVALPLGGVGVLELMTTLAPYLK